MCLTALLLWCRNLIFYSLNRLNPSGSGPGGICTQIGFKPFPEAKNRGGSPGDRISVFTRGVQGFLELDYFFEPFNSTIMESISVRPRFSPAWDTGWSHLATPAFTSNVLLTPLGKETFTVPSVKEYMTLPGCQCIGDLAPLFRLALSTRTRSFSSSTLYTCGATITGSCSTLRLVSLFQISISPGSIELSRFPESFNHTCRGSPGDRTALWISHDAAMGNAQTRLPISESQPRVQI